MKGTIREDATVLGEDGKTYQLPVRPINSDGFPHILINAKAAGGKGYGEWQSVEPFVGKEVQFVVSATGSGVNYVIVEHPRNFDHTAVNTKPPFDKKTK